VSEQPSVDLLRRMVEIASPSGQERELALLLVAEMQRLGLRSWIDNAGNAIGEIGEGPEEILLLGHMDTAPGFIPVRIENGLLYGRGSVDAKGPLAAFICAAGQVGARPGKRLVVVGAVEEECASSRGARHLLEHRRPSMVIIGEPSGWDRVTLGYKGRLLLEYTLRKPVSHTAGKEPGACERAVDFWLAVRDHATHYNAGQSSLGATLDASLRSMSSSSDGLTEVVQTTLALRIPPGLELPEVRRSIAALCPAEAQLSFYADEPPFRAAKSTPLVAALLSGIRAAGGTPVFSYKTGTSDMNVVGPVWNCPIAAYGPGDSALDHTPNEHLLLEEYQKAITVLTQALRYLR
jgi:LysW-gamma-L-lysine carboxypeptidase